jgi:hypothetical protein
MSSDANRDPSQSNDAYQKLGDHNVRTVKMSKEGLKLVSMLHYYANGNNRKLLCIAQLQISWVSSMFLVGFKY